MKYFETNPSFYKKAAAVAGPVTLQSVITIGVNMIDTIMLGSLGETALSASSLGNQFIMLFQICCMGIGMGATVLTARYWGKKDVSALKKVITIALRFTLIFALLFTIVNAIGSRQIIQLYSTDASVIEAGAIYLKWSTPTFILGGLSLVCTNIMRSVNLARVPLVASAAAFLINIGANYTFIFGNFGAPRMGVAGAALGTVIARTVEMAIICGTFLFFDKSVGYRIRDFFMKCRDMVKEYIRVSVPVLISDGLLGLGNNIVAMIMGRIGTGFVSANAITMVTQQLSTIFIQGISFSGSIITGHTLGEGRVEDAKRQGYTFFWLGLIIGCLAGGVIFLLRTPVINAYNITAETRQITEQLMDAISIIVIFQAANSVLTKGVLRGGGDTRFLMIADIFFLWAVSIPLGAMAGMVWGLSPFWIYTFLKIDQIIKAIWCVFRLRSGKWIKKVKGDELPI